MKTYMYIFVQEGLQPEQVAIQSAHAAFEAGKESGTWFINHPNLVLISAASIGDIKAFLELCSIEYSSFYDEDVGSTTICTVPLEETCFERRMLSPFKTLRFSTNKPVIKY